MPTLKPRISITLDAADLAVLDRFAAASGQPRASFIAAMIAAAVPEFSRAADVMELAKEAPAGVVRSVVDGMSNATTDALGLLAGVVDQSHDVLTKARGKPGKASSTARRAGGTRLRGVPAEHRAPGRKPPQDPHPLTGGSK